MSRDVFPVSGGTAAAGSCSDGGASPRRAFSPGLWDRLWSAFAGPGSSLRRQHGGPAEGVQGPDLLGGLLSSIGHRLGMADHWAEAANGHRVGEERALPLRDLEPRSPLWKGWGNVWPGIPKPVSWYGLALKAACFPTTLNPQTLDQWTCEHPASLYQEKPAFSIWTPSDLPISPLQRMEKPAELPQLLPMYPDHGYFSLEEEHACSKQHQFNTGHALSSLSDSAQGHCGEANDLNEKMDGSGKNEEAVLLQLDLTEIEDKMMSMGDDEWDSSDDETENDSEDEDISLSLRKPQCSNQTMAYILGSPSWGEDEGSEDGESDWGDDGFDSDGSSGLSDETENLWNSLVNCSDPYNLLNFQASIKTRHKLETRSVPEPSNLQQPILSFPVIEDFEDRLDSGFSDVIQEEPLKPHTQLPLQRKCTKKVAFDERVTEYYVSSEEIRKGPWEEYARDRCRFQKRIKEIEECIGHCFTLEHRWTVLNRMQLISQ